MALGSLVGRGFVRIDADTKPAEKAIKALGAIGSLGAAGALGGAIAPITTAVMGLASAFATAGGAAAVFGAAVKPQFQEISGAMTKQTQAENAQTKATNSKILAQKMAKDMGIKYGQSIKITSDMSDDAKQKAQEYNSVLSTAQSATKAATQAQQAYKAEMSKLPPATQKTAEALQDLKSNTASWSDSLSSSTMPIFTKGIKFLQSLLPKLTPIVKDTSSALMGFLNTLGEGSAGKVFREFGANVTDHGADMLRIFLNTVRNVITGVVGLFNAFQPAAAGVTIGLAEMSLKFADWSAGLSKNKGFQDFLKRMQEEMPKFFTALGQLITVFGRLAVAAGPFAGITLKIAEAMITLLNAIPMSVLKVLVPTIISVNLAMKAYALYTAAAAAATWLFAPSLHVVGTTAMTSRASLALYRVTTVATTVATTLATYAVRAFGVAMAFVTSPIGIVVLAIAALVAGFIIAYKKSDTFRSIVKAALNGVKDAALAVANWFTGTFVPFFTKTLPNAAVSVKNALVSAWNYVHDKIIGAYNATKKNAFDPIVNFFTKTLPNAATSVKNAVVTAFRVLLVGILTVFGSIIKGAATIFGWVPGVGGKLKKASKAFDNFKDDVNRSLGGIKDKSVSVDAKFTPHVEGGKGQAFSRATGGPIHGPGSGTSDDVPVWASNGEHMWSTREVEGAGGHSAMYRLRKMARAGVLKSLIREGITPGFAAGGAIDVKPHTTSAKAINSSTDTAFSRMVALSRAAITKVLKAIIASLGLGGKDAAAALKWARTQVGKPYVWGGVGPRGYDCSGFQGAIQGVLQGQSPYRRRWATGAFSGSHAARGWVRGLRSAYEVGITNKGVGHTAGTLAKVNVESSGGVGVRVGGGARGAHSGMFPAWYGWKGLSYDQGGLLPPGLTMAYNGTGKPERVLSPGQSGGVTIKNLQLVFQGPVGSRRELENWLVSSFEQLQRQGRIRAVTR